MKKLIWAGGFVFLILAGSLLHVPQWVAKAAAIYSSPMSDVLLAYRTPYQSTQSIAPVSAAFASGGFPAPAAGHRLVVQHISVNAATPSGSALIVSLSGTQPVGHVNQFTAIPSGTAVNAGSDVLLYFDPTDLPTVQFIGLGSNPQVAGGQVTLTGYIENCAAYPTGVCPTIQQ